MPAFLFRLCLISILFICGCGTNRENDPAITGTWQLQDIVPITGKPDFDQTAQLKKLLKEGAQVSLFKDRTYSFVNGKGDYVHGTWRSDGNIILLQPVNKTNQEINLELGKKSGKSQLAWKNSINHTSLLFAPVAVSLSLETDDPFHPSNNKWRKKPEGKENEKLIRERLKNYIRHFALILKAAQDRNQNIVSFEYSQGPVRIYSGAIGIYPFHMVPDNWKKSFFDESDADIAYQMVEQVLNNGSYRGASAGNWIDDDYNILLSVYSGLVEQ